MSVNGVNSILQNLPSSFLSGLTDTSNPAASEAVLKNLMSEESNTNSNSTLSTILDSYLPSHEKSSSSDPLLQALTENPASDPLLGGSDSDTNDALFSLLQQPADLSTYNMFGTTDASGSNNSNVNLLG